MHASLHRFLESAAAVAVLALSAGITAAAPAAHAARPDLQRPVTVRLAAAPPGYQPVRHVTVRPGDTLAGIAAAACGSAAMWPGIYAANRAVISDPDLIQPGWRLLVTCRPAPAPPHCCQQPAAPDAGYTAFQRCVITRESGGDPRAVNPSSGAGGLYGFLPSTWHALGFAGLPEDAPPAVQDAAFREAYRLWGTAPWRPYDGC